MEKDNIRFISGTEKALRLSTRNSNERAKKISLSPAASKSLLSYWGY
jgi:hypothetical protein